VITKTEAGGDSGSRSTPLPVTSTESISEGPATSTTRPPTDRSPVHAQTPEPYRVDATGRVSLD
jgi:hypothetical protein